MAWPMPNSSKPVTRKCCRCACVYDIRLGGTDTHCPECLMKGMP